MLEAVLEELEKRPKPIWTNRDCIDKSRELGKSIRERREYNGIDIKKLASHIKVHGNWAWDNLSERLSEDYIKEYIQVNIERGNMFTRLKNANFTPRLKRDNNPLDIHRQRYASILEAIGYDNLEIQWKFMQVQELSQYNQGFLYVETGMPIYQPKPKK